MLAILSRPETQTGWRPARFAQIFWRIEHFRLGFALP
jgi:hypothetical protein